jgi:DNA repair exonuclease SbcCD ATPase subunit
MENVIFKSYDEIQAGYDSGDMEIINGVLEGTISLAPEQPTETFQETVVEQPVEQTVNPPIVEEDEEDVRSRINHYEEELEREKRIREMEIQEAQRKFEETEAQRLALLKINAEEKRKREEIENRLRELDRMSTTTQQSSDETEEDEFVSEYTKKTRQMVEELRNQLGNNPKTAELEERIQKFEQMESERIQRQKELELMEQQRIQERRMYEDVGRLQTRYDELKTEKNIEDVHKEFEVFRKEFAQTLNVQGHDLERSLMQFFDAERGKDLRSQVEKRGLKVNNDIEKFVKIAELVDLMNGKEYDPVLQKFVPVLSQTGDPVRYRSLEEAYRVKHFNDITMAAKKRGIMEAKNQLEMLNNAPATLKNTETKPAGGGMTVEQANELINTPPERYANDPEMYNLVKRAYAMAGIEMPVYRGRRF